MDDLNRVSDAILERKILYPGKTSIRDYGTSAKVMKINHYLIER